MKGHVTDPAVKKALEDIAEYCVTMKVLGSYPRGD
jgi:prephenate dehydratase